LSKRVYPVLSNLFSSMLTSAKHNRNEGKERKCMYEDLRNSPQGSVMILSSWVRQAEAVSPCPSFFYLALDVVQITFIDQR
jgi:hypothetical protein